MASSAVIIVRMLSRMIPLFTFLCDPLPPYAWADAAAGGSGVAAEEGGECGGRPLHPRGGVGV